MKLENFLVKAKINTYATDGEGGENVLNDNSKELDYEEGEFKYRDRYFGFNPFVGEEIVWQNDKIIWSMNYYGKIISDIIPERDIYEFLKKAMKSVKEDRPFRGPENLKENDFEYIDKNQGGIKEFIGEEKILYKGKEIYKLYYHGGFIR